MKNVHAAILGMACAVGVHAAGQDDVQSLFQKYHSVRPKETDLTIYELDWAPTLKAAKDKAMQEERPIFLVVVLNSFGNVCSGHC